ncbi:MAG: hypothetical protein EZS28_004202 [Streblomastix strix]|uniref:Kinetochore protein Nuf2 N-terminal domain-containing protein n=1 Tax=Streblomastix strix TaxID=222440 RepID=A0A5J4X0J8_9EUKA|nr:MAG: hypothetical protein EZS28_004202 [Streblomastix strix]
MKEQAQPKNQIALVVKQLEQYEIIVTEDDLRSPTSERVLYIYSEFLNDFTGFSQTSELHEGGIGAAQTKEEEILTKSKRKMKQMGRIISMMHVIGVPNFSIKDLIAAPSSSDFIKNIKLLLNYELFKSKFIPCIEQSEEPYRIQIEQNRSIEEEISRITRETQNLIQRRMEEEPLKQQEKGRVDECMKALEAENRELHSLIEIHTKKKEEAKKRNNIASQRELVLIQLEQEKKTLEAKIIQSPEKIQQRIFELNAEVQQRKMDIRASEEEERETQQQTQRLRNNFKEIQQLNERLRSAIVEKSNNHKYRTKTKDLKRSSNILKEEIRNLEATNMILEKELVKLDEEGRNLERHHKEEQERLILEEVEVDGKISIELTKQDELEKLCEDIQIMNREV